ncbi:hypothetical protein RhiirA4_472923 [Rhizophagus irregularis]|uniref:Uncharacterized protein n=1 Tax=Rhizophagus irregularis TaxID=588596 RepID=A0A2I1H5T7_9GLOM|nr:hypothetical protein RhiirA4_472923 [Rhizophagus irregularis]
MSNFGKLREQLNIKVEKLRQQNEQAVTIPSVEENEISPSDHNVNNERHLPSHQNKNLTIPVVTPYQPIDDLPTSYSQANVGWVFLSQNVDSQFTQFRCLSGHFHMNQEANYHFMPPKQINQQTNKRPFYKKKKNRQSKNVKLRKIKRAIEHQEKLRQQSEQAVIIPSVEENEISPSDHNVNNERHLPSHQNENLIPVVTPCQPIDDLPSYSQANVGRVVLSQNVDSQFTEFRCLSDYFHKDQEDLDRCYKNFIKKYGNNVDKFMDIYSCIRLEAEDFILKYSQLFL